MNAMKPITTPRLQCRCFTLDDAPFVLQLVNDPAFVHYIGDKGVRTLADARNYLEQGPIASYAQHGFGLYRVDLRTDDTPIGMCGLLQRDSLPDVDIGFAYMPEYRGRGYAFEAASATLAYGYDVLKLPRIVAVTSLDNARSGRLLEKIGLSFDSVVTLPGSAVASRLFTPDGRGLDGGRTLHGR